MDDVKDVTQDDVDMLTLPLDDRNEVQTIMKKSHTTPSHPLHQLGSKVREDLQTHHLGEDIREVLLRCDVLDLTGTIDNVITKPVILHSIKFRLRSILWSIRETQGAEIVFKDHRMHA